MCFHSFLVSFFVPSAKKKELFFFKLDYFFQSWFLLRTTGQFQDSSLNGWWAAMAGAFPLVLFSFFLFGAVPFHFLSLLFCALLFLYVALLCLSPPSRHKNILSLSLSLSLSLFTLFPLFVSLHFTGHRLLFLFRCRVSAVRQSEMSLLLLLLLFLLFFLSFSSLFVWVPFFFCLSCGIAFIDEIGGFFFSLETQ